MINLKSQIVLLICIVALPFTVVLGWMTYSQSKTKLIQTKVQQAFDKEVIVLSPHWTRIEVHNDSEDYYSPIIDSNHTLELYRYVLEDLNQDENLPLLRMNPPAITKSFSSSRDSLICQVTIEFSLPLGINRKIMLYSTTEIPHYTTLN